MIQIPAKKDSTPEPAKEPNLTVSIGDEQVIILPYDAEKYSSGGNAMPYTQGFTLVKGGRFKIQVHCVEVTRAKKAAK